MDSNEENSGITEAVRTAQEALSRAYADALRRTEGEKPFRQGDDLLSRCVDHCTALTRASLTGWRDSVQMGLNTTFDFQKAGLRMWHTMSEAGLSTTCAWFEQAAGLFQAGRDRAFRLPGDCFGLQVTSADGR